MSRKYYIRVFKDPGVLQEMLALLQSGWSSPALAEKYGCDTSTILHHARRKGVDLIHREVTVLKRKTSTQWNFGGGKYDYLLNEPVNQGKDYYQYRQDAQCRKQSTKIRALQINKLLIVPIQTVQELSESPLDTEF